MKLSDIIRDAQGEVTTLIVSAQDYSPVRPALAKALASAGTPVGYVTVNRSCFNAEREFAKKGIPAGSLAFIDATDAAHAEPDHATNHANVCLGMVSPGDLTSLSIRTSQLVKEKTVKSLIVDTASALLLYNQKDVLLRFLRDVSEKLRTQSLTTVYLVVADDIDPQLRSQFLQLSDSLHNVDASSL